MQDVMAARVIGVGLDGTIQFQKAKDTIECIVQDITEDYTETVVVASDPRVCMGEDVDLKIFLPTERSPVKCTGRIAWHREDEGLLEDSRGYLARIFITHMGRIDRRRLELVIARKRAFIGSGYGLTV